MIAGVIQGPSGGGASLPFGEEDYPVQSPLLRSISECWGLPVKAELLSERPGCPCLMCRNIFFSSLELQHPVETEITHSPGRSCVKIRLTAGTSVRFCLSVLVSRQKGNSPLKRWCEIAVPNETAAVFPTCDLPRSRGARLGVWRYWGDTGKRWDGFISAPSLL